MKALVGVKRVLDYAIKVRVNPQRTGVELQGQKMSMNPFDEIAVEEALKMREAGKIKEVVALTIGDKQ
jgi:electron transfer flavoprotein beta subunit